MIAPLKTTRSFILFAVASATAFSVSAHAQTSLQAAFNFTQYGTVAPGSTVTSNVYGNTTGILQTTTTSLTSSGLAITGATTNAGQTGLQLSNGSLTPFTGDFSIQQFYTNTALPGANTAIMGGVSGTSGQNNNLSANNAFFVAYSNNNRFVRPIESNGGQFGTEQGAPANTGNNINTLNDLVITYSAGTKVFTEYLNGTQVAQGANAAFTSLSAVTNFSIAGVSNPAFGDSAVQETTSAFRFYTGTLTQSQVTALDGFGPSASLAQIGSTGVLVPEPSTWAMSFVGAGGLALLLRARRRTC